MSDPSARPWPPDVQASGGFHIQISHPPATPLPAKSAERAIQRALQDAQSGRIVDAIAALRLHLRLNPRSGEAMAVLGMLLAQDGQLNQAIQQLSRAVQLMPNAAGAHSN